MKFSESVAIGDYHSNWNPPELSEAEQRIIDEFHKLYYKYLHLRTGANRDDRDSWLGYRILKCPLDLFTYQEILLDTKPDIIIETGTFHGGSALYLATLCQLLGRGRVITLDVRPKPGVAMPKHPLIEYRYGYSQDPAIADTIKEAISPDQRVMVILDSDHRKEHVLQELALYAPLVSPGCYLIVEDSNFNGHPIHSGFGPGPMEAIQEFIARSDEFKIDRSREKHFLTFNPSGYLIRLPSSGERIDAKLPIEPLIEEKTLVYYLHDESPPGELPPGAKFKSTTTPSSGNGSASPPQGITTLEPRNEVGEGYIEILLDHFQARKIAVDILDIQSWCGRFGLWGTALLRERGQQGIVRGVGSNEWVRLVGLSAKANGFQDTLNLYTISKEDRERFIAASLDVSILPTVPQHPAPAGITAGLARGAHPDTARSAASQSLIFNAPGTLGYNGFDWLKRRRNLLGPAIEIVMIRYLTLDRVDQVSELFHELLADNHLFYLPHPDFDPRIRQILPGTVAAHAYLATSSLSQMGALLILPKAVPAADDLADRLNSTVPRGSDAPAGNRSKSVSGVSDNSTSFFIHIPKTGGQSLWQLMAMNIGTRNILTLSGHPPSLDEFYWAPASTKAFYKAVYGHFVYGMHHGLQNGYNYFTWLRDPLSRVISDFYENRREPFSPDYERIRAGMTLVEWLVEQAKTGWKRNLQCKAVGGIELDGISESEHLAIAKRNLATMTAFGVTERLEETALLFAKKLGWRFLLFGIANRGEERAPITSEVREASKPLIDQDILLYEYASGLFDQWLLAEGPGFQEAFAAYRRTLVEVRSIGYFREGRVVLGEPADANTIRVNREVRLPAAVFDYLES